MAFRKKRFSGRSDAVPVNQLPTEIAPAVPERLAKIDPSLGEWRERINKNWTNAVSSLNRKAREGASEA